jgi:hypothetical protein
MYWKLPYHQTCSRLAWKLRMASGANSTKMPGRTKAGEVVKLTPPAR